MVLCLYYVSATAIYIITASIQPLYFVKPAIYYTTIIVPNI